MRRLFKLLGYILLIFSTVSCSDVITEKDFDIWGIDVSKYQHNIKWDVVSKKNRPHFVFVKATEGTLIKDPYYKKHIKDLNKHEILWGAYHFFGHRTSGKEQAQHFIKTANLKKGNLIPVLDIEKHRFMKDAKKMVQEAKAFCNEINKEFGVNPIIYCSSHFYDKYLKSDFKSGKYIIWVADYSKHPDNVDWHIWQHTDSFKIGGGTHIDRNVFRGSLKDLEKLIMK